MRQPTGTNRSFDSIAPIAKARIRQNRGDRERTTEGVSLFPRPSPSPVLRNPVSLQPERKTTEVRRRMLLDRHLFLSSAFRPASFAGLVALGEAIRPDPIPNSAVKRLSANGTLS